MRLRTAFFPALCSFGIVASAQVSDLAVLGGKVFDPQHRVIQNATVIVTSDKTKVQRVATTNSTGDWRVDALLPGDYHFQVESPGFKTLDHSSLQLQVADQKFVDVTMALGCSAESVSVESETPLIDTTAAVSGLVISSEMATEIPNMSNSPIDIITMAPGVLWGGSIGGALGLFSNQSLSSITINGAGNGGNAIGYSLDGINDTIIQSAQIAFVPPVDAVQETRITTNAYDGGIGNMGSGTLNMSTKSGGQSFHGSLYERVQKNIINARYPAAAFPLSVHFNEWGGTIGGPVLLPHLYDGRKRGLFFFFSYDGLAQKSPNSNTGFSYLSLPTALERQGDFSQSFTTVTVGGVTTKYPLQVFDPLAINTTTGNRQQFSGNVIPQPRISPVAKGLLSLLPLPNRTPDATSDNANNYQYVGYAAQRFDSWLGRLDKAWNNSNHTDVDFGYNDWHDTGAGPFGIQSSVSTDVSTRTNYIAGINHSWVVSPSLVLNFLLGGNIYETTDSSIANGIDPTQYGFSSTLAAQQLLTAIPAISGGTGITLGASNGPSYSNDYNYQAKISAIQTIRNHSITYGADFTLKQYSTGNLNGEAGSYSFSNIWTVQNPTVTNPGPGVGSAYAAFDLGLPASGSESTPATSFWSQPLTGEYVQDNWRVTPKLTLNMGLRWDVAFGLTERFDKFYSRFDPNLNITPVTNVVQPNYAALVGGSSTNIGVQLLQQYRPNASTFVARGGILYAGVNGTSRAVSNVQYQYFQPRFGFAYRVYNNTVLRGGYGRFVQPSFFTNHASQLGFSASTPFIASNDNYFTPAATLDNPYPNGLLPTPGSSGGPFVNAGSITSFYSPNAPRQTVDDASLKLQQQIKDYLIEIGGVVDLSGGLGVGLHLNAPSVAAWQAAYGPQFDSTGRPLDTLSGNTLVANPFLGSPLITNGLQTAKTIKAYQLLLPNPLVNDMVETVYTGSSTHLALQARVEKRYKNGFSLNANYTWGQQMDTTGYNTPFVVSQKLQRVLSGSDIRFTSAVAGTYILPFGRGMSFLSHENRVVDALVGGWQVAGIYNFNSGTPIALPTNSAFFRGGDPGSGFQKSRTHWFNTDAFRGFPTRSTTTTQLGSLYPTWTGVQGLPGASYVPRVATDPSNGVYQDFGTWNSNNRVYFGTVRNPYVNNVNLGVRKSFRIVGHDKLELRIDSFNALNHPRYGSSSNTVNASSAYFGNLNGGTAANVINVPRTFQFGGRYTF